MKDNDSDKNSTQKFVIKTKQGEVVISWPSNQRTGFCPYCHKCIPLNSIVFKKENENSRQMGECPYCHKEIPVCEITFKKTDEEEQ